MTAKATYVKSDEDSAKVSEPVWLLEECLQLGTLIAHCSAASSGAAPR